MSDLISRQAAINLISQHTFYDDYDDTDKCSLVDGLRELPPAQPESKTGKWIEKEICETRRKEEMQVAKCSNCGKYLTTSYIYSFNHYSFCLNCGAKMDGGKAECGETYWREDNE